MPGAAPFRFLSYSQCSLLSYGDIFIQSEEGVQQGDPFGPLLFCLMAYSLFASLVSHFTVAYLDNLALGDEVDVVAENVERVRIGGLDLGLHLNETESEFIECQSAPSCSPTGTFIHITSDKATLLGAPIHVGAAMDVSLSDRCNDLQ